MRKNQFGFWTLDWFLCTEIFWVQVSLKITWYNSKKDALFHMNIILHKKSKKKLQKKNMYLLLLGIDKRWILTPFRLKDRLFLRPLAPEQGLTGEGGLTKIWGFFTGGFPGFPEGNRVPWSWESPRSGLINPPTENCRQFLGLAEVALLAVKFNSIQK